MKDPIPPLNLKPDSKEAIKSVGQTELLEDFWSREKKPDEPEVKFKIAFGHHNEAKDIDFFRKDFEACDIYLPENITWTPELKEEWGKLSRGEITAAQFIENIKKHDPDWQKNATAEFEFSIARMVEGSQKFIGFIDTYEPTMEMIGILSSWQIKFKEAKFLEEKVVFIKQCLPIFAQYIKARETTMFEQIPNVVRETLNRNPKLKQKPQIKVLLSLGAAHTPLFMKIKSVIPDSIERSFQKLPFIFDDFATLIRKQLLKGEVGDQEIEKAILELEKKQGL